MALDHSRINLPLTYRANDAHPKICPQEEANSSLSFRSLRVGFLVWSPTPTYFWILFLFLLLLFQLTACLFFYHAITTYSCSLFVLLFIQLPQSPRTPRQKSPLVLRWESGLINWHNNKDLDWERSFYRDLQMGIRNNDEEEEGGNVEWERGQGLRLEKGSGVLGARNMICGGLKKTLKSPSAKKRCEWRTWGTYK